MQPDDNERQTLPRLGYAALIKGALTHLLIGLAIGVALFVGSRTTPGRRIGERRLRPTVFVHGFSCFCAALLILILRLSWNESRSDQILWGYGLSAGLGFILVCWTWYFYVRVIYWNARGIGGFYLPLKPRFFPWQDIEWAGRTWDGSFLISTVAGKIRYSEFDGGHEHLNRMIKRRLPHFAGNF